MDTRSYSRRTIGMKPGDLVQVFMPGQQCDESIGLIVRSDWYVDQVSEPHGLADVLVDGQMWYAIPFELLFTFDANEKMENT